MKNTEKRMIHLNPEIIEAFENNDEMLLIKGGSILGRILKRLGVDVDFNCGNSNSGC